MTIPDWPTQKGYFFFKVQASREDRHGGITFAYFLLPPQLSSDELAMLLDDMLFTKPYPPLFVFLSTPWLEWLEAGQDQSLFVTVALPRSQSVHTFQLILLCLITINTRWPSSPVKQTATWNAFVFSKNKPRIEVAHRRHWSQRSLKLALRGRRHMWQKVNNNAEGHVTFWEQMEFYQNVVLALFRFHHMNYIDFCFCNVCMSRHILSFGSHLVLRKIMMYAGKKPKTNTKKRPRFGLHILATITCFKAFIVYRLTVSLLS